MMNLDVGAKKYLSCVKSELRPYSFSLKRKALCTLSDDLLSFAENVPNADFEQICKHFGRPASFAENLLDAVEPEELRRVIRRRRILTWSTILLLIAFLILSTWNFIRIFNSKVTHTIETTIVYVEE